MVIIHDLPTEFVKIVLAGHGSWQFALAVGLTGIFLILVFHVVITWFSLRYRRATQRMLGFMVNPFERALSRAFASWQRFSRKHISPYRLINGYPPADGNYEQMARNGFRGWRLDVGGLVERPVSLTQDELCGLGYQRQITKHNCIQGWTGIAEWGGVPMIRLIELVKPLPHARHVVFYAMDDKGLTEGEVRCGFFCGSVPVWLATEPQTLSATDMNGAPLPVEHGAPLRLRIETRLGFKMVKWIVAIEFTDDIADIGMGAGRLGGAARPD